MNKKIKIELALGIILFLAILVGGMIWSISEKIEQKNDQTSTNISNQIKSPRIVQNEKSQGNVCPSDSRVCPDGTEVERIGPACKFAECLVKKATPESVALGQKKAYLEINETAQDKYELENYVYLSDEGKRFLVNKGISYTEDNEHQHDVNAFSNLRFSPRGNYLLYDSVGFEWGGSAVYDTERKKQAFSVKVRTTNAEFTREEDHFMVCGNDSVGSGPYGEVLNVPGFKSEYKISETDASDYSYVDCRLNQEKKSAIFTLFNSESGKEDKVLEYSLISDKE